MLILITLLIASTASHRVTESIEDLPPDAFNTTTLFPVGNNTNNSKESDDKPKVNADATVWKLETAFGESKLDEKEANQDEKETKSTAAPAQENKTRNSSEEFRPSPHLGSFFDEDSLEITPTRATVGDFRPMKKPASGFISFPKDNFKASIYSIPKEGPNQFPYKIEPSIFTRAKPSWRPSDTLESRPTVESPMRVPAGGLYKSPEAFKLKPDSDEDFGLSFDDVKENNIVDVKKRVNPWKNLLHLMTALIPVGLIFSALTPNIINVHSIDGPDNGYPTLPYRRSDGGLSGLAPISEPCRRRLLCELHSDKNYLQNSQPGRVRRRHCHRLPCEEPEALAKMLQWLLSHKAANHDRGQHFT